MKTYTKLFLLLIGAPILFIKPAKAQSSQPLPEFDKIKADGYVNIELVIADRHSAYSGAETTLKLEVSNGTLIIDNLPSGENSLKIYTPKINAIQLDGAAHLTTTDTIRNTNFSVLLDGASTANIIVITDNLKATADGAANLTLAGKAQTAVFNVDGAAKINALTLIVEQADVKADGIAAAKVNVTKNLIARADGTANISFTGNPTNKTLTMDGVSHIKSIDTGDDFTDLTESNTPKDDTTKVNIGNKKVLIFGNDKQKKPKETTESKHMKRVYSGFEFGLNALVTPDLNFKFDNTNKFLNTKMGRSWFVGFNILERDLQIVKNKVALTTGLGFNWSGYRFDGSNYLTPNIDSVSATTSATALSLNQLNTFDINAPLLIKYAPGRNNKKNKGFHIAAGAIFRYIASVNVKTETTANGYRQMVYLYDDFNINPLKVDATVRVGYNKLRLFANYSLTPYFNANNAPDVRTFAVGITLLSH